MTACAGGAALLLKTARDACLCAQKGKVDLSLIGSYLAKRWWALRQAKLAHKLDANPLKAEFKEGSVQYNELKKWMLGNGHGCMMLMHNPLVRDLKASKLCNNAPVLCAPEETFPVWPAFGCLHTTSSAANCLVARTISPPAQPF